MTLVTSIEQIEKNVAVLHAAIRRDDSRAIELVKNGKSIVITDIGGKLAFAPSRFVGYRKNSLKQHIEMRSQRDGRVTNDQVRKVLGFDRSINDAAEAAFRMFCNDIGASPPKNNRQYWVLVDAIELVDEAAIAADETTKETEKYQLQKARRGQGKFRAQLLRKWGGCCITGCEVDEVLRASHIKPWRACTNKERLDSNNGLLLVANIDALFDRGLISFDASGSLIWSDLLSPHSLDQLVGRVSARLELNASQARYLQFHRESHGFE